MHIFMGGSIISFVKIFQQFVITYFEWVISNARKLQSWTYIENYDFVFILRVFRLGSRLTVDRPLDITASAYR